MWVAFQALDPVMASGIDATRRGEKSDSGVGEFAVGEVRPEVAGATVAFADKDLQPALCALRIARVLATRQCIAKFVERRAAADQRLLECRQRLAHIDEDLFILSGNLACKCRCVLRSENLANDPGHM